MTTLERRPLDTECLPVDPDNLYSDAAMLLGYAVPITHGKIQAANRSVAEALEEEESTGDTYYDSASYLGIPS